MTIEEYLLKRIDELEKENANLKEQVKNLAGLYVSNMLKSKEGKNLTETIKEAFNKLKDNLKEGAVVFDTDGSVTSISDTESSIPE